LQAVVTPTAAAVAVHAVHSALTTEDFLSDPSCQAALPHLLVLLLRAVQTQPSVHARVLRLVAAVLPGAASDMPELTRSVLRILLEVLLTGSVVEALMVATQWSVNADPVMVRSFALQVWSPSPKADEDLHAL
jgi:nitric oxide reductase activation protein